MGKRFLLSALLVVFATAQTVTFAQEKKAGTKPGTKAGAGNEEVIAKIASYRDAGEQKLVDNKFTRKTVSLQGADIKESIKQKWEKMDAYYDGTKLVRLQLYPRKGVSERTEEFYLMDNKLVFAFIQDKGPKHEGKDAGEPGKELYFHNDKLIKFENRSGEPTVNVEQEKKMYENRLPYEVADLLEILKKS